MWGGIIEIILYFWNKFPKVAMQPPESRFTKYKKRAG